MCRKALLDGVERCGEGALRCRAEAAVDGAFVISVRLQQFLEGAAVVGGGLGTADFLQLVARDL